MGRRPKRRDGGANDNDKRVELGPFWLHWRAEREVWCIAWYDDGDGRRSPRIRRKATSIGSRLEDGRPPQAAVDALADHYAAWRKPVDQPVGEAVVEGLFADWLTHVEEVDAAPERAAACVAHWLEFFELERKAGRITRGPYVTDVKRALCERYMKWRLAQPGRVKGTRISGGSVSRELAALRAALRWAWQNEIISSAPFVPDVEEKDKAKPKDLVYTPEEVARLLEAAWRLEERRHVHLCMLIMLSTHGRGEAVLELEAERQLRDGLIYFLEPGATQTEKRRSIVPIAPTLAPWLDCLTGKLIRYRTRGRDPLTGEEIVIEKPTLSIKTAFEACLVEAGICDQETDGGSSGLARAQAEARRDRETPEDEGARESQHASPHDFDRAAHARRPRSADRHRGRPRRHRDEQAQLPASASRLPEGVRRGSGDLLGQG